MRRVSRMFVVLGAAVLVSIPAFAGATAMAAPNKSISFDCDVQSAFGGDIYLKPNESLTVSFSDCEPQIYIDVDTDPTVFTSRITRPSSDGSVTFYSDGTYIINATVPPSEAQGVWLSQYANHAYMWMSDATYTIDHYVGVFLVGDDVSTIRQALVQNLVFEFPSTLTQTEFFTGVAALDTCIDYNPSAPSGIDGDPIPYKALDFVVQAAGDVTIRTDSTVPTSSFTSFVEDPLGGLGSMLSYANYLLYDDFEPQNPGEGLIACGDYIPEESVGDYLASGEIRMNSYAELSNQLNAGTYTLVAVPRESLTVQDWQNFAGNQNQYLRAEVWTPLPQASSSPALAATGEHQLVWFSVLGALSSAAGILMVSWRYSRAARNVR